MNGVARWWTESVAALGDVVPLSWLVFILVMAAILTSLGWANWERLRQVRWAWPKLRLPRRRRPEPTPEAAVDLDSLEPDALPAVPAATLLSRADQFAAQGRFAEAIRERLRAMVRLLVDRRVIDHHPGWTVTELATAAGRAAPAADRPLGAAGTIFSDVWYGQKQATADDDATMRLLASDVDRAVARGRRVGV